MNVKPSDIMLGNFISVFGKAEMVMGITPTDGNFYISHTAAFQENSPIGPGISFAPECIPLTSDWLKALRLDCYTFPADIEYVHEAQNYAKIIFKATLLPDYEQICKINEVEHDTF